MRLRSSAVAAAMAAAGTFGMLVTAAPAQADTIPDNLCGGVIDVDYCLWYNSNQKGGWTATYENIPNWVNWNFSDGGQGTSGVNTPVKNNAASYANSRTDKTGVSYFNSNYGGASDVAPPRDLGNLVNTYNNNASFRWR
ncbi:MULTISPECIES: peptidase M23 [unclassified Streptomyces]|uniref:peptidase M23 n=1 Tax=unclassified Streptomyces TaxID=2593676 RepID=UPI00225A63CC|nr:MULTISPECIES: peptidase M23 [unclassified Streptomyces]MCX5048634.1 peptidase M23 [Streptomyces sp. NBC_00474]MCX5056624.1 peptidase M23 [Streptomyces sp. NBC_00452]MCX5246455.1 peptidase M23 [Streptomyces sp. NBC_00201]MCX5287726.1 peptidase M23 [Streptomyces sp. NBC_00183]